LLGCGTSAKKLKRLWQSPTAYALAVLFSKILEWNYHSKKYLVCTLKCKKLVPKST
jgi:hypothetical protein